MSNNPSSNNNSKKKMSPQTSIHHQMTTYHLTKVHSTVNNQFQSLCSSSLRLSAPKFSTSKSKITKRQFLFISTTNNSHFKLNLNNAAKSPLKCSITHDTNFPNKTKNVQKKSFWAAVTLVIGTAVGPGMLGLPSATIISGSLPSTIAILLSWVYVISSIILVAELSFATMEEDDVEEVSFTGLVTKAFGAPFGAFVSLVYASLSFSLLVACVSGIGSIVSQWFPNLNNATCHSLLPLFIGCIICFFPFEVVDSTNRFLCCMMVVSIITLVGIGVSVARANVLVSLSNASWNVFSILPAIPVTVLTLGFHVITPFICKVAGDSVHETRKAIIIGGIVPLVMVLSWNLIVLGLAGGKGSLQGDPIKLLLSVKSSALFAIQGFAFSALATSFIGYVVSFPKQLIDTFDLIFRSTNSKIELGSIDSINGSSVDDSSDVSNSSKTSIRKIEGLISVAVLLVPVLVASFYPSTFSRALDFAGVYANCFLFGILPPAMAYIYKSKRKLKSSLPGGNVVLFLLFSIAVILSIWH